MFGVEILYILLLIVRGRAEMDAVTGVRSATVADCLCPCFETYLVRSGGGEGSPRNSMSRENRYRDGHALRTDAVQLHTFTSVPVLAVAQWLRCCATNRKVADSVPDVVGIFH